MAFTVLSVGSVCSLWKGGTVCLGPTAGRAKEALLLPRGFDAAAFLPGAEQLWTTEVRGRGMERGLTGYAAAPCLPYPSHGRGIPGL